MDAETQAIIDGIDEFHPMVAWTTVYVEKRARASVALRRRGMSVAAIAELFEASPASIYLAIAKIAPELISRRKPFRVKETKKQAQERRIKDSARSQTTIAIRNGRLKRPDRCSACNTDKRCIQAHHPDYSKPLDVVWLCTVCHGREHARIRMLERQPA